MTFDPNNVLTWSGVPHTKFAGQFDLSLTPDDPCVTFDPAMCCTLVRVL